MKEFISKCKSGVVHTYKYGVVLLFYVFLVFIGVLCALSTCALDINERVFFIDDSMILNICAILGVILCFILINRIPIVTKFCEHIENDEVFFFRCRKILLGIIFVLSVIWILGTQFKPRADQLYIQNAVHELRTMNFTSFMEGGYVSRFHQQLGLVLIYYLLSFVFGTNNYVFLQLVNAFALVLFYRELSELSKRFGFCRIVQLGVVFMGIIFFPLIMYCSFIYGNLLGLAFGVLAIRKEFDYFEKDKIFDAIISAICILLAILCKSNYLIFLIGMLGQAVIEILHSSKYRSSIFIVMLVGTVLVQSTIPSAIAEKLSGHKFDQGTSSLAYIAMGLQESPRAPGWYNRYVIDSYEANDCNTGKQAEEAKMEIINRITYFANNKSKAGVFFLQKLASQWADPTFQSFWIVQSSQWPIKQSNLIYDFRSEEGEANSIPVLNLLQIVCIFGGILYCVLFRKKMNLSELILPLIFIGGFIFHTFWEAKGQYTLSYFVLLFPYMIEGYNELIKSISNWRKKDYIVEKKKDSFSIVLLIIGGIIVCGFTGLSLSGHMECLEKDTDEYIEYVSSNIRDDIENGTYYLYTSSGMMLSIIDNDKGNDYVALSDSPSKINISKTQGMVRFCVEGSYHFFTIEQSNDLNHRMVSSIAYQDIPSQRWLVKLADENGIYIKFGDEYALTFDEENSSVFVSSFTGDKNQVWYVEHVE